jgi:hypothetical protein
MEVAYLLMCQEHQFAFMINLYHQVLYGDHLLQYDPNAFQSLKHHQRRLPMLTNRHLLQRFVKQLYQKELNQKKDDQVGKQLLGNNHFVMEA